MKKLRHLWPLPFLAALALPEVALDPFRADLPPSFAHWLGTDLLGRDALARLALATARSLGFGALAGQGALLTASILALAEPRFREGREALRSVPALLWLLPVAAATGGLGWGSLGLLLTLLLALQAETPLRRRFAPLTAGPAWALDRTLGLMWPVRLRKWGPWALNQALPVFPSLWVGALWGEATLRLLGLGPSPQSDSLGLVLLEELPRLATDPTPLGWAALGVVLALAWGSTWSPP